MNLVLSNKRDSLRAVAIFLKKIMFILKGEYDNRKIILLLVTGSKAPGSSMIF